MIQNYSQPRDTVELIKQNVTPRTAFAARPIAIGTQYELYRYGQEDPVGIPYVTGDIVDTPIALQVNDSGIEEPLSGRTELVLDADTLKVYADNLLIVNGDFSNVAGGTNEFLLESVSTPNRLRHNHPTNNLAGGILVAGLNGRAVAIGDTLLVDDNVGGNGYVERKVTGLLGRIVDRHVGSNVDKDNESFAAGAFNPPTTVASSTKVSASFVDADGSTASITVSGAFGTAGNARAVGALNAGDFAEVYTVTFNGAPTGAGVVSVTVTSASGKFPATTFNTTNNAGAYVISNAVLCGSIFTLAANVTPAQGDVFVVRVVGAYTNAGSWVTLDNAAEDFTGLTPTTISVRVTTGAELAATEHTFQVSDSAGTFTPFSVARSALAGGVTLGTVSGLVLGVTTFGAVGFRTGDTFYISAVPDTASSTEFNGVVLSGPAADTTLFVNPATPLPVLHGFRKSGLVGSDWVDGGDIYSVDEDSVEIELLQALGYSNGEGYHAPARTGFGTLYPSFRAAIQPGADETAIIVRNVEDLAQFGADDADNELGKAINSMFTGALGLEVSALRVGSSAAADYADRFKKLQSDDAHYAHNALAESAEVRETARQHLEAMSVKTKKRFRRGYMGINSPGRRAVLKLQPDTTPYTATVTDYGGSYRLVTFTQDIDLQSSDIDLQASNARPGDEIVFPVSGVVGVISEVLSATEVLLTAGLDAALSPAVPVELWKPDNARNTMDYIIEAARSLSSDRVCLVWCEGGRSGGVPVPSQFIASEIAGLRTAVLPQVGLSGTQLRTVTSATPMYARFTEDELNEIASHGVMIVMQDGPGAPCYIRHQLTTRTDNGILSWEDSCGYNHDMVGFTYKAVIAGYRGQTNRTEATRLRMESDVFQAAVDLSQSPVGQVAGSQITDFYDENGEPNKVTVRFDTTFADRFFVLVDNGLPVPVNGTDAKIRAHVQEIVE